MSMSKMSFARQKLKLLLIPFRGLINFCASPAFYIENVKIVKPPGAVFVALAWGDAANKENSNERTNRSNGGSRDNGNTQEAQAALRVEARQGKRHLQDMVAARERDQTPPQRDRRGDEAR